MAPNEQVFDNKGKNYASGRPGYAEGAVEMILNDLLKPGNKIADIGSGTGIFSKEFISRGYDVYCVEPNEDMRRQAEEFFGDDEHFHSVAAPAENTTLPDHSVDLITAASAFHWFDLEAFRAECKRILKPGGYVCCLMNARDYNDPFTIRQHEVCKKTCPTFTSLKHGLEESEPKYIIFFGDELHRAQFNYPLDYTKEKFIARSLSSSYSPITDENGHNPYIEELTKLLDEYFAGRDKFTLDNVTDIAWGRVL